MTLKEQDRRKVNLEFQKKLNEIIFECFADRDIEEIIYSLGEALQSWIKTLLRGVIKENK
jgi:hypothetical protein